MSLCLDIERCKISSLILPRGREDASSSSSRRVIGYLEATYKERDEFVSEDFLVRPGNCVVAPWDKSISALTLNMFVLQGIKTVDLGVCSWEPSSERKQRRRIIE